MSNKLAIAVIGATLLSTLAACTNAAPEPTPTATVPPTPGSEQAAAPQLTNDDYAYTAWLAALQDGFEETVAALIRLWQSLQEAETEQPSADTIADMEQIESLIQDYVKVVEDKEDVPANMAQVHAALLEEVQHWEVGASLLVESAKALSEGDQEQFEAKAKEAGEAVEAAGAAREELVKLSDAVLGRTEGEESE